MRYACSIAPAAIVLHTAHFLELKSVVACCLRQVTYESDLSVTAEPKLPEDQGHNPQAQLQKDQQLPPSLSTAAQQLQAVHGPRDFSNSPEQLHDKSDGVKDNLAALRAMDAPSDSDDSDEIACLPVIAATPNECATTTAETRAGPKGAEEAQLVQMEDLWIRVQELEVEHALLGRSLS